MQSYTTLNFKQMVHEEEDPTKKLPIQPGTRVQVPNHEQTKCSMRRNGIVRAYAANTNMGLVRNYNEDRVSIILNIQKPEHRAHESWPKCSFFGVYDGHGGSACAEFLRDNLHLYVVREDCFPWNPKEALQIGFNKVEQKFLESCQGVDENGNKTIVERSGSCAIVVLIVGETCFVANVGDSRAVMSVGGGSEAIPLSTDHKPSEKGEYARIVRAGGQVYQTTTATTGTPRGDPKQDYIVGPIRVLPGRLSVSRTFGDPEAKLAFRGGNPDVVVCTPDIRSFQLSKEHDFILLASDGIFDKLSNEDAVKCAWVSCNLDENAELKESRKAANEHEQCGMSVETVLKNSLYRQSLDNVTVVMIAFSNFKRAVFGRGKHSDRSAAEMKEQPKEQAAIKPPPAKNNAIKGLKQMPVSNQALKVLNDENQPPTSARQSSRTKLPPHPQEQKKLNIYNSKNMNHLIGAYSGREHSHDGALKEKTSMFVNRPQEDRRPGESFLSSQTRKKDLRGGQLL